MEDKLVEDLKEYVGVLIGSRTVSAWEGNGSATYKQKKGTGHLVINIGDVKLGEECEKEITNLLQHFIDVVNQALQGKKGSE